MSKPDWKDAPEFATFLACDCDGTWWWFESEPFLWEDGGSWEITEGHAEPSHQDSEEDRPDFWEETLEPKP